MSSVVSFDDVEVRRRPTTPRPRGRTPAGRPDRRRHNERRVIGGRVGVGDLALREGPTYRQAGGKEELHGADAAAEGAWPPPAARAARTAAAAPSERWQSWGAGPASSPGPRPQRVGGGPVSSIMGGGPLDRAAAMIGTPMAKFEYVGWQLRRSQPGPHTDTMLAEVLEEARLGRIVGPLRAPHWWPGRTVALHCLEGDLFAAAAFAISQPDGEGGTKIRRGEDWRRSAHNSTVATDDVPTHHMVQDFAGLFYC